MARKNQETAPETAAPEPEELTPPPPTPRSSSDSTSKSSSGALRSQLAEIPRLIQTNMALLEQKYSSIVELQNQQLEQVKQIVAQLNALFQVAEEFLSNVDEVTDKLIEETAAIVQLRTDLAAEALAQNQTPAPASAAAANGSTMPPAR